MNSLTFNFTNPASSFALPLPKKPKNQWEIITANLTSYWQPWTNFQGKHTEFGFTGIAADKRLREMGTKTHPHYEPRLDETEINGIKNYRLRNT